jgi:hypothetical protein
MNLNGHLEVKQMRQQKMSLVTKSLLEEKKILTQSVNPNLMEVSLWAVNLTKILMKT